MAPVAGVLRRNGDMEAGGGPAYPEGMEFGFHSVAATSARRLRNVIRFGVRKINTSTG